MKASFFFFFSNFCFEICCVFLLVYGVTYSIHSVVYFVNLYGSSFAEENYVFLLGILRDLCSFTFNGKTEFESLKETKQKKLEFYVTCFVKR